MMGLFKKHYVGEISDVKPVKEETKENDYYAHDSSVLNFEPVAWFAVISVIGILVLVLYYVVF